MSRKRFINKYYGLGCWLAGAAVLAATWSAGVASAQTDSSSAPSQPGKLSVEPVPGVLGSGSTAITDGNVVPAGCSTCGSGLLLGGGGCSSSGGCGSNCIPGRYNTCCVDNDTWCGRLFGGIYECICCPDPCYEPRWIGVANAAFFVDSARPVTQMRFRYDAGFDLQFPDRNEYFWARAGVKGPKIVNSLQYNDLGMTAEVAAGRFSLAIETLYRSIDPEDVAMFNANGQLIPPPTGHHGNFGDMNIATKSLLLDCELLQVAFQFRTYIPTGNFTHGIGNGHVSLEPSLLAALRLGPDTYLQGQLSEWIPLGGDQDYQGAILHEHFSLNQVLWRPIHDVQVIGTLEFNGWHFQDGQFTDPVTGPFQKSSGDSFLSAGPGIRMVVCDKIDFGVAAAWQISGDLWPNSLYRTEFRWRF
jgi:hypothetical protein